MRYLDALRLSHNLTLADTWVIAQGDIPWNCFCQFNGPTENIPLNQGIKLHLSCPANLCEYIMFLDEIIPVLQETGATFKVVLPSDFKWWCKTESTQRGKFVTIYNHPFDVLSFLEAYSKMKFKGCVKIPCEVHFGKGIFGRYAAGYGDYVYDEYGNAYSDDRNHPYPPFIDRISLRDFVEQSQIWDSEEDVEFVMNLKSDSALLNRPGVLPY